MLEEKLFDNNCSVKEVSTCNVSAFLNNEKIIEQANVIKNTLFERFKDNNIILQRLNFRKNDKYIRQVVNDFLINNNPDKASGIKACLCICFRIRNNMFHGEKNFSLLNDQIEVFRNINIFIDLLLNDLI